MVSFYTLLQPGLHNKTLADMFSHTLFFITIRKRFPADHQGSFRAGEPRTSCTAELRTCSKVRVFWSMWSSVRRERLPFILHIIGIKGTRRWCHHTDDQWLQLVLWLWSGSSIFLFAKFNCRIFGVGLCVENWKKGTLHTGFLFFSYVSTHYL